MIVVSAARNEGRSRRDGGDPQDATPHLTPRTRTSPNRLPAAVAPAAVVNPLLTYAATGLDQKQAAPPARAAVCAPPLRTTLSPRTCLNRAAKRSKGQPAMPNTAFRTSTTTPARRRSGSASRNSCAPGRGRRSTTARLHRHGRRRRGDLPYCATRFVYEASLGPHSIPPECELHDAA